MKKTMICRCFGHSLDTGEWFATARRAARLMVGVADYDADLAHGTAAHPDEPPLSREAFFQTGQAARYGQGGGLRCC